MAMTSAPPTALPSKQPVGARQIALAAGIGAAAVVWLTWLSGWLGVRPGTVVTHRHNVIFSSDTNLWIGQMLRQMPPNLAPIHPLQIVFWSAPCRAMAGIAGIFLPPAEAGVFGTRLLAAILTATGIACLAWLALRCGVRTGECLALFAMYLLFTSNATICLPEHFGISSGLLALTFVVPRALASTRMRLWFLGAMTVLIGGTTITNTIFPVLSLVQSGLKSARLRAAVLAVGAVAALGAAFFLYRASTTFHFFIGRDMRWRFLHDPLGTGAYLLYFLAAPAVGPHPLLVHHFLGPMVTYEPENGPLSLARYLGIQGIGASAWLALLGRTALHAYRRLEARPAITLLFGWLLFNFVLHNVWGDELLLYAPHWSWALMALVALGAARLSRGFVLGAVLLVVAGQIPALLEIKRYVDTIVIQ